MANTAYENPMTESAVVDFRALCTPPNHETTPVLTTSSCGHYFLLASGAEIYTYEILGHHLRLVSRTSCGKRVVAMAIDASDDRLAIAALLEGRIGIHIDLTGTAVSSPAPTDSQ